MKAEMLAPIIESSEESWIQSEETIQNKKNIEINIPSDWWYSISTFEVIVPKTPALVYKLPTINNSEVRLKRLPMTNYWKIRQGDYRSKAKESKTLIRMTNIKRIEYIWLSVVLIFSIIIVLLSSYLVAVTF